MRTFLYDGVSSTFCDSYFLWDSCFPSFSSFFHSLSDGQRRSNLGCHTATLSTRDCHFWFCNFLSLLSPNSFRDCGFDPPGLRLPLRWSPLFWGVTLSYFTNYRTLLHSDFLFNLHIISPIICKWTFVCSLSLNFALHVNCEWFY